MTCFTFFNPVYVFLGFSDNVIPTYDDGSKMDATQLTGNDHAHDRIIKFGRTSGLTKGALRLTKMVVKNATETGQIQHGSRMQTHVMSNQIQIDSFQRKIFFDAGDSGSAVFLVDKNNKLHCIGMAIGVTPDGTCMVTPIKSILEELGHDLNETLELKAFHFERMDH